MTVLQKARFGTFVRGETDGRRPVKERLSRGRTAQPRRAVVLHTSSSKWLTPVKSAFIHYPPDDFFSGGFALSRIAM
jgi:hypothetical protein